MTELGAFERFHHGFAEVLHNVDEQTVHHFVRELAVEVIVLDRGVVEAEHEEVEHVRAHGLAALRFDELHDMVIRTVMVFDEDLADYAYARFGRVVNGQFVELFDHLFAVLGERRMDVLGKVVRDYARPLFVKFVGAALDLFVRAHAVEQSHRQVGIYRRIYELQHEFEIDGEAAVLFETHEVEGYHGHLLHVYFFERFAYERDIVGRSARSARLRDDERGLVRVVLAAEQLFDEPAHGDYGGVACVVVDVFQADVYRRFGVLHDFHVEAEGLERGLVETHVERGEVGRDYRVTVFLHLLGELLEPYVVVRFFVLDVALPALLHDRHQRTYAYARRAEVVDLVYLEHGIQLVRSEHEFLYLVGRHRVAAAAEGVELYELEVVLFAHVVRCRVQAGMVHPLVEHAYGVMYLIEVGNAVFGEHREAVGVYHLGYAMVDLGVEVIGTSREHYPALARFVEESDRLFAHPADIVFELLVLVVSGFDGCPDLLFGDIGELLA